MRKLLFLLLCLNISIISTYAETYTSVKTDDWSDETTWDKGSVPGSADDVVIADGHVVTIASIQTITKLTINGTNESSYGTLIITTGANLTTTASDVVVYGKLYITGGEFNEGNGAGDKLTINGSGLGSSCLFSISGGIVNISRYIILSNSSSFEMSGGTINVNSYGGTSNTDIFNFPSGTSFTMSSGIINILNGNFGSGVALKFNPSTSNISGGTINFTNVKEYNTTTMISTNNLPNIVCDVGASMVLIIQNMPSSTDGFICNDYTVTSGITQIYPCDGITVSGALSNNVGTGGLVVQSTSEGNGSLIAEGTVSGDIIVERYFAAYTNSADGWHLIGSPVDNMTISGSDFDPAGTNNDLYAWDEDDYIWRNFKGSNFPGTTFTNGLGYMVAYEGEVTNTFSGSLNTSDVTFTNLSKTPAQGDGWHLLGNPYSSALKWNDGNWTLTDVGGVAKVYNETTGNYNDINTNGIIPSTNGFFVQVSSSTNTILIPSASRVHNATNNYKNSDSTEMNETLRLMVNNDANNFSDITSVGFRDDAETTFDWAFDSHKMFGQSIAPQLWTVIEGEELSTNKLPLVYESLVVPLYFKAGVNSVYHIIAEGIESFYLNSDIYLEDKLTGSMIDLRDQPMYTFEGNTSDDNYRFDLHFFGVTNTHDEADIKKATIYSADKNVFVRTYSNGKHYQIELFDITGRRVLFDSFVSTGLTSFRTDVEPGMYFVLLRSGNSVITKKLFLR